MAPLASFKGSRFISQVNYYTNIVPQKAALNGGPWKMLEDKVRDLVDKYGHVWGMSGPIYERDMPPLPQAAKPHKVPSAFWMIVVASKEENPNNAKALKVAAFIMDQDTKDQDNKKDIKEKYPLKGLVSVEEVEQRTRLNFFWELSPLDQRSLESEKATTWAQEWLK
jgi:endonuclease G